MRWVFDPKLPEHAINFAVVHNLHITSLIHVNYVMLLEHYPRMTKELHQWKAWLQCRDMLHPNLLP